MSKNEEVLKEKKSILKRLDNFFEITKRGSSFRSEIIGGLVTFLAMVYILTVNPNQILGFNIADPRWSSIFIATAIGAIVGTLLMALVAKMPLAQASGMGLNSTLGMVIGGAYGFAFSLGSAFLLVLISGVVFLIISVVPCGKDASGKRVTLREKVFDGIPKSIRNAITVGIGFFIAFIGMQNAKIVVSNPYTFVEIVNFKVLFTSGADKTAAFNALVALFGFVVIVVLAHFKVKGAVIYGILASTILALPLGVTSLEVLKGNNGVTWKFWEYFANFFSFDSSKGGVFLSCFTEGFSFPKGSIPTAIMLVITFCMIDMFDTMGTVVGCATNAGLVDENGKPTNFNKIMYSDSIATCVGSLVGTSTVTTFVESGSGIASGAKTGFASVVTALLFFLSIFLLPVFAFIPSSSAAAALIYVGVLMMGNVKNIDFSRIKDAAVVFVTIIGMILGYSITVGIGLGVVTYVVIELFIFGSEAIRCLLKKEKLPKLEISLVLFIVFLLFLVYFLVPVNF